MPKSLNKIRRNCNLDALKFWNWFIFPKIKPSNFWSWLFFIFIKFQYSKPILSKVEPAIAIENLSKNNNTDNLLISQMQNMTPEQKVGQMFLIGIFTDDSTTALDKLITDKKIGSIILLNPNIKNKKIVDVTTHFQEIALATHQPPLLISVDQEGGLYSRIQDIDSNQNTEPNITNTQQAYDTAFERGKELQGKGVSLNFAPVLDYVTSPNSFLYERVFRGTKEDAIAYGESMVQGYQDAGIISSVKHFPGHDNDSVNSHKYLPTSTIDKQTLEEHTRIFREVIKNSKPLMVMTAHVLFPKIDPNYPATLSPVFIKILRNDYDYNGVIITDDMNMGAITKTSEVEIAAVQAIQAGNDMLLYVAIPSIINRAYIAILTAVKNGQISEKKIDESVYRILTLKEKIPK